MVRYGFPDLVGGTTHCLLLMLRILLRVQAWHRVRKCTSGEWAGTILEGWAGTTQKYENSRAEVSCVSHRNLPGANISLMA